MSDKTVKLCEECIDLFRDGFQVLAAPGKDKEKCDNCGRKLYARPVKLISKRRAANGNK